MSSFFFLRFQIFEVLHHLYVQTILDHLLFGPNPTSSQFYTWVIWGWIPTISLGNWIKYWTYCFGFWILMSHLFALLFLTVLSSLFSSFQRKERWVFFFLLQVLVYVINILKQYPIQILIQLIWPLIVKF